ncbi:hypothetical protein FOA52_003903 [Chlamydomonas sp. UWO 241]|nr:hypothetical protein FOA52_003903 [Chlamydomonas sp. UWO 241]
MLLCSSLAEARRDTVCHTTATTYVPSVIELESLRDSLAWQNSYCEKHEQSEAEVVGILDAVSRISARGTCRAVLGQALEPSLSHFVQTVKCGQGVTRSVTTAVEPLYSILRHPSGITCREGVNGTTDLDYSLLMSTDHIITADASCPDVKSARTKIYIDLGASSWREQSQSWMVQHFEDLGIEFDRMLFWEARPMAAADVFRDVPRSNMHAFQYFNVPCSSDPMDPANPLNVLKRIGTAEDYVVVKLDIDNSAVEAEFISQILNDPDIHSRINEFFWEPHYQMPELIACCWLDTANTSLTLTDVFENLLAMRKLGVRAHGWP